MDYSTVASNLLAYSAAKITIDILPWDHSQLAENRNYAPNILRQLARGKGKTKQASGAEREAATFRIQWHY